MKLFISQSHRREDCRDVIRSDANPCPHKFHWIGSPDAILRCALLRRAILPSGGSPQSPAIFSGESPVTSKTHKRARLAPSLTEAEILRYVRARTRTAEFRNYLRDLLLELCRIDTTPKADVQKMREAEEACFRVIERELRSIGKAGSLQRYPIHPAINKHRHFSLLHFTKTPQRPNGLTAEEAYTGRSNLVFKLKGSGKRTGASLALNAHIDVVAPYITSHTSGKTVQGRGACDDKGPVVAIVAAIRLLSEILARKGLELNRELVAMFVVEEETGGNGSLSLAMDRELKKLYESVMVCECTGLKVHPANRGAVWYRAKLKAPEGGAVLELAAFVIEELEREGAAIRAESAHRLFPQRPVQTCHGIIGPFGEHPSRICGEVGFRVVTKRPATEALERLVRDCLDFGLATYIGLYGDKTKVVDSSTGNPVVARHYDLRRVRDGFEVQVHGAAGHMGAIRERDGAITKMAHLVRSLCYSKERLEKTAGNTLRLELAPGIKKRRSGSPYRNDGSALVLEGGQGFVPTHDITEIMERLRKAAQNGAQNYLNRTGRPERARNLVTVSYEKLHNVAFDGDPDSPSMRNALAAAKACGLPQDEPVLGWTVSCDARLFASEYAGLPVLTFGPGQLAFAHSDHEQIDLDEVRAAVGFLVLFILKQTGTISGESSG